ETAVESVAGDPALEMIADDVILKVVKNRAHANRDIANGEQANEANHDAWSVSHQVFEVVSYRAGLLPGRLHALASCSKGDQEQSNRQDAINQHGHLKSSL